MHCPACRSELETAAYHEVEVDRCPSCSGVWLDYQEVDALFALPELPEKLLAEVAEKQLVSIPEGSRTCPRCRDFLLLVNVDQIPLDVCSECHGMFLDSGEFARLARAAEERYQQETEEAAEACDGSGPESGQEGWKESIALVAHRLNRWYQSRD